ncbi:hypothetical protein FRB95_010720 [Tulasnella sp. JGI-2019a]|nr:hypothetical protein FRB95_010720 [Tulasnella sp. JGI-2019a]
MGQCGGGSDTPQSPTPAHSPLSRSPPPLLSHITPYCGRSERARTSQPVGDPGRKEGMLIQTLPDMRFNGTATWEAYQSQHVSISPGGGMDPKLLCSARVYPVALRMLAGVRIPIDDLGARAREAYVTVMT